MNKEELKKKITKEELIEACKGKVFKCESQEEWESCIEKCKSLGDTFDPILERWEGPYSIIHSFYFGEGGFFSEIDEKSNTTAKNFLSLFTPSVTIDNNVTAIDNPSVSLTKREMILKNKKDVVEVCDKALVCYAPEGHELCRFDGNLYRPAQGLNPSDMVKLANWILNLEKVVK